MANICITNPTLKYNGWDTIFTDNYIPYEMDVVFDASPNALDKSFCDFVLKIYEHRSKLFVDDITPSIYFSSIGVGFDEWNLFEKYYDKKTFSNFIMISSPTKYIIQLNIPLNNLHNVISELSWLNYYYQTQKFADTVARIADSFSVSLPHKDIKNLLDGFLPSYMQVPFPEVARSMYDTVFKYVDTKIIHFPSNMTKDLWHKNS